MKSTNIYGVARSNVHTKKHETIERALEIRCRSITFMALGLNHINDKKFRVKLKFKTKITDTLQGKKNELKTGSRLIDNVDNKYDSDGDELKKNKKKKLYSENKTLDFNVCFNLQYKHNFKKSKDNILLINIEKSTRAGFKTIGTSTIDLNYIIQKPILNKSININKSINPFKKKKAKQSSFGIISDNNIREINNMNGNQLKEVMAQLNVEYLRSALMTNKKVNEWKRMKKIESVGIPPPPVVD